jgi:hypothetical protein
MQVIKLIHLNSAQRCTVNAEAQAGAVLLAALPVPANTTTNGTPNVCRKVSNEFIEKGRLWWWGCVICERRRGRGGKLYKSSRLVEGIHHLNWRFYTQLHIFLFSVDKFKIDYAVEQVFLSSVIAKFCVLSTINWSDSPHHFWGYTMGEMPVFAAHGIQDKLEENSDS